MSVTHAMVMVAYPFHSYKLPNRYELRNVELTENYILLGLFNLDITIRADPDGIPPTFLKECANSLVKPLYFIFHRYIFQGIFPSSNINKLPKNCHPIHHSQIF